MAYDDSNLDFELSLIEPVIADDGDGGKWTSSSSKKSQEFKNQFFGNFGNNLKTFTNDVAASGDTLPYGVAAVWSDGVNKIDFTKDTADWSANEGFDIPQVTDGNYDVGAGISTYLLEGLGLDQLGEVNYSAQVQKFAFVLDTGVAELTNLDLNVGKYASSKYTGDLTSSYDLSKLGGMDEFAYEYVETDGEVEYVESDYYTYSQLLSASFLDYNYDGVTWDDNPFNDDNKHGTHVAGTIAAKADGKGVVGVAPGAEIISMKVLSGSGGGSFEGVYAAIVQSATYILEDEYVIWDGEVGSGTEILTVDTSNITTENTVINMSLGADVLVQSLVTLIEDYAAQGVVFSLAAGNSSIDVDNVTPAAAGSVDGVYTVSAVDNKYNNAWFTNYDNDDDNDADDDSTVAGPGVNVLSYNQGSKGDGLGNLSGTSMAAPAIAGLLLMDPMDVGIVSIDGSDKLVSSQWYVDGDFSNDFNLDGETPILGSGVNTQIGIQMGEDALPVSSAPYVDPFALSTLSLLDDTNDAYEPTDPIEEEPDDGDEGPADGDSPWDGYDPGKTYYKTSGSIQGVNGTYSLSTGYGASQQSVLESDLSIQSGKLDSGLSLTQNDLDNSNQNGSKASINATEGSGVKLTGFAETGDTVSFDYILSSNDYIPYNDFSFVQLQSGGFGDTSANLIELSTLGAIGLDVANFGTKTGSYSYTFSADDFGKDANGDDTDQGFFDLSVGVTDAIDGWVDTTLLVQALSLNGELEGAESTFALGEFTWNEDGLGNASGTGGGEGVPSEDYTWSMSTGAGSTNQMVVEAMVGLESGILDTDLSGTKSAINAQEGSAAFADAKAKIGDFVTFDWNMETNDYAPYKDFSFYSINDQVFKLAALGENIANYGKATGSVSVELTEDMFDMSDYVEESGSNEGGDFVAEGGDLVVSFGVMDALDWCVDSSLKISDLDLLSSSEADQEETDSEPDATESVGALSSFNWETFGNFEILETADPSDKVVDATVDDIFSTVSDSLVYNDSIVYLTTQYSLGDKALVSQSDIEFYTDMDSGTLDTSLGGTKDAINATSGSALQFEGMVKAGDTLSFAWAFETSDYVPYEDFAYFNINGDAQLLVDSDTGAEAIVSGPPTNNIVDGVFTYEITTDDIGGLVGDALVSVGITNSLDNAAASSLYLSDFVFSSSEYFNEDGNYEDEYDYFGVDDIGDVYGEMEDGFFLSTGGDTESVDDIEDFFGQDELDSLSQSMVFDGLSEDGDLLIKSAVDATEGSAVKFTSEACVGDKVSFWYYFETDDYVPYADFSFYSIGDEKVTALAGIGDAAGSEGVVGNVANWGWKEDYVEFIITEDMLFDTTETEIDEYYTDISGKFDLTIGVVDALDTAVDSMLVVGGLEILSYDEDQDESDDNYDGDEDDGDDYYDEDGYETPENNYDNVGDGDYYDENSPEKDTEYLDPQLLGNAFFAEDAVVLSTGGGASDQSLLEDILGIKYGDLDTTLNGTKEATNATEGSAAYTTVEVDAGDVVSFGYTFGTDDYIPYQDFAFVSINGKVSNLATVGVECPNYSEISDVFNYVISEEDLGGVSSGLVQLAVGIVDSTDTWVDSYIEIYDFSINDEEMVDDSSGTGIIDGAGAFSINTSTFDSGFGGFVAEQAKAIKINFDGDSVQEDDVNYDIIASAESTLSSNSDGYQILLEGVVGKNAGKYAVYQTDKYGTVLDDKSGWKSIAKSVDKGWEDTFNIDLDNNSILSTEDNSSLTVYSSTNGAITIKEAVADSESDLGYTKQDISSNNVLAATPAKADFNAFSTSSSTYQVLISESPGLYQKWTANEEGIIINKDTTSKTGEEAATAGWENIFKMDFNADGLLSGDSIYKIFNDNGPLVLKNFKGAALEVGGDYGYSIVASKLKADNEFDIVVKGDDGSQYDDQWNIWTANSGGKVVDEGAWITTAQMVDQGLEQSFEQDFTGDGYQGKFDSTIGSDSSGLGVALASGKFAMLTKIDSVTNATSLFNITQGSKNKNLKVSKNVTLAAAESFESDADLFADQTLAVLTNNKNNNMKVLTLNSDYNVVGKTAKYSNNSVNYLKMESAFSSDFNGDGIIASWDNSASEFSGEVVLASVSNDQVTDFAVSNVLDANGAFSLNVSEGTGPKSKLEAFGDTLTATFKNYSFDSFSINSDASELSIFMASKNFIKTILFETNSDGAYEWNNSSFDKVKNVKIGSTKMLALEEQFDADFNGDGESGEANSQIYSNSSVGYLFKDTNNVFQSTNNLAISPQTLTKGNKGKAFKATKGFDLVAIDDDSVSSEGLLVSSKNGSLKIANFNGSGKFTGYNKTIKAGTSEFYDLESQFGLDVDSDSITGLDKSGDDSLGLSDLSVVEVTNMSATYNDLAGSAYAYDSDSNSLNPVVLDKQFANLSKKGWSVIATESVDTDADSFFENFALISNSKGSAFKMYILGESSSSDSNNASWEYTGDVSAIDGFSKGKISYNKNSVSQVEDIFNQNFDGVI
jgi:hypothetical protein